MTVLSTVKAALLNNKVFTLSPVISGNRKLIMKWGNTFFYYKHAFQRTLPGLLYDEIYLLQKQFLINPYE